MKVGSKEETMRALHNESLILTRAYEARRGPWPHVAHCNALASNGRIQHAIHSMTSEVRELSVDKLYVHPVKFTLHINIECKH